MVFVEAPEFTRAILRFPDDDYTHFQLDLAAQPRQEDVMQGCGGFRKARMGFPSVGVGKSGGARVIYLHVPELDTIYLVHIYGKSRKSNLSKAEQNALRQIAHEIRRLGRP